MITGVVTANQEATIPLVVQGARGQQETIDAVIDTGFTGSVTLPPMLITALGLSGRGRQRVMLGDGSVRFCDVYAATILWDGQVRTVEIDATYMEPLMGMHLLAGHEVRMQVVDGDTVTSEALP